VVTAYILIQTEVGKAAQVAKDIVDIIGVQQAQAVTGPYDVIVRAEARNLDELGQLVVARVHDRAPRVGPGHTRWARPAASVGQQRIVSASRDSGRWLTSTCWTC
jgi:DNA-binding Lrp family transcriptional regulator